MRLLFFSHTLNGGGAERVLSVIVSELSRQGHEVHVSLNVEDSCYDVDLRVTIHHCISHNRIKHAVSAATKIVNYIRFFFYTRRILKSVQPDVAITFQQCNMLALLFWHGKTPIVSSEHNAFDRFINVRHYFNRFILNRFYDRVTVLSSFDEGYAKSLKIKNVSILPNPCTYKSLSVSEYDTLFPHRQNILACGRLSAWYIKGLDLLIDAFGQIAPKYPSLNLDVIGGFENNSFRDFFQKKMAEYHLEGRIHLLGFRDDIDKLMKEHLFLVAPSRTEGFSMVIIEAMSCGMPCIATNASGPSSIILNDVDGVIVDKGNVPKLVAAMEQMIVNKESRHLMGLRAVENVQRFDAKRVAQMWETMLQQLAK